jgi:hypothetical protein
VRCHAGVADTMLVISPWSLIVGRLSRNAPHAFGGFNAVKTNLALMRRSLVTYPGDAEASPAESTINADNRAAPQRKWHSYDERANRSDI